MARWPDRLHVRVSEDQREALTRLAAQQERTASSVVREAVALLIREHEPPTVEA